MTSLLLCLALQADPGDYPVIRELFRLAARHGVTAGVGAGTARDMLLGRPLSPVSDIDLVVDSREPGFPAFRRDAERVARKAGAWLDYYGDLNPRGFRYAAWVERPNFQLDGLTIENLAVMSDGTVVDPKGRALGDLRAGRLRIDGMSAEPQGLPWVLRVLRMKAQYPGFEFTPESERLVRGWIAKERPNAADRAWIEKNLAKYYAHAGSPGRARALLTEYGVDAKLRAVGVDPGRFAGPDEAVRALRTSWGAWPRGRVALEAGAAAEFAGAYFLKETIVALETGDGSGFKAMAKPEFWTSLAVFTAGARLAEHLPLRGVARTVVPLAVGMAAVQILSGRLSPRDLAIDTAAFLAAGVGVAVVADTLVYPALFAAGPPGWIAAGLYTVGKLALTLYFGEKLGAWLRGLFDRHLKSDIPHPSAGFKQKVDDLQR